MTHSLYRQKLEQAGQILREVGIDAWLIYVRETALNPDPVTELLWSFQTIWPAAFLITASGERIATGVVHDAPTFEASGLFTRVLPFQKVPDETLPDLLRQIDPQSIALNYSLGEVAADGLSHGLFLNLQRMLEGTPYPERFTSAEQLIGLLRQRKLPAELALLKEAACTAHELFDHFTSVVRPGMSETEIAEIYLARVRALGIDTSWDRDHCPNVNAGPNTGRGHLGPLPTVTLQPGDVLNIDFGVKQNGYCSDHQRVWYVLRPGESAPPESVMAPFRAVAGAIQAGFAALRPGVQGWEVDAAARKFLTDAGYPEYLHALGHNVGRYAHDGGVAMLCPRWPSYGERAYGIIEPNQLLTIELGVWTEHGYIGLEEEALVTESGAEWFWPPQTEPILIAGAPSS
jgi:Xaa-Pro aminopeptidase